MIVRGLRAVSDFEFEFQMALMNQRLKPKIETVFMMPAEQYTYISSRLIKEVFSLGGRVHGLVPDLVEERLREKATGEERHDELADRTTRIAGSPTMKVTATVDRLRREGVEVIDFGAGEPDFPTPDAIKVAAHLAIDENFTKYTPVAGIAELKRAICDRYRADYGVDYTENRGHRHRRRQAGALQHRAGAVRPGRRSHHARAVLADDSPSRSSWPTRRRCSCAPTPRTASRSARRPFSTPSRRGRAASSSTRRATRPAR